LTERESIVARGLRSPPLAIMLLAVGIWLAGKTGTLRLLGFVVLAQGIALAVAVVWLAAGRSPLSNAAVSETYVTGIPDWLTQLLQLDDTPTLAADPDTICDAIKAVGEDTQVPASDNNHEGSDNNHEEEHERLDGR
jgi:hypothetical protein